MGSQTWYSSPCHDFPGKPCGQVTGDNFCSPQVPTKSTRLSVLHTDLARTCSQVCTQVQFGRFEHAIKNFPVSHCCLCYILMPLQLCPHILLYGPYRVWNKSYLLTVNLNCPTWWNLGLKVHPATFWILITKNMMTSSNENIFRVTVPLCGEFIGHRWILRTKASDADLWCFLWSAPE